MMLCSCFSSSVYISIENYERILGSSEIGLTIDNVVFLHDQIDGMKHTAVRRLKIALFYDLSTNGTIESIY